MGEARFSWHVADGDVRYGLDAAEPHAPLGDGPRRPPGVAPWRTRAGRGDDPRLGLAACPGVSRPPARLAREHAVGPPSTSLPLGSWAVLAVDRQAMAASLSAVRRSANPPWSTAGSRFARLVSAAPPLPRLARASSPSRSPCVSPTPCLVMGCPSSRLRLRDIP